MEFKFKDYKLLSQDESGEILNIRNDRKIRQISCLPPQEICKNIKNWAKSY